MFPDFDFDKRNNEIDHANDLTDEFYQSNY